MKVFKMDKVEILESEIKRKIIFLQKYLIKSRTTDDEMTENIPKYLNSIASLQKENDKLRAEQEKMNQEHLEDLKQVDTLLDGLSKLVENDHA